MARHVGAVFGAVAVGVAFVAGSVVAPRPTVAVDKEPKASPRIGFVHLPKVLSESRKAKKLTGQMNARRTQLVDKVNTLKAEVDEKQKAIVGVRFDLTEKEKLENEIVAARRQMEDIDRGAQKEFSARTQQIVVDIYKDVNLITAEIAKDFGLDAVLAYPIGPNTINPVEIEAFLRIPAAAPLFVDKGADFTPELLKRMNQKFDDE